jgi:hypothetical protein
MTNCVALREQRELRDLQLLEEVAGSVDWLDRDELAGSAKPAVLCGLALADDEKSFAELLGRRRKAGHPTIMVPRFRAGDLGPTLSAPVAVNLVVGGGESVSWSDGVLYDVSSVVHLETDLGSGRWATNEAGTAVLCHRANTAAGPTVVCAAAVASRATGVSRNAQRDLFERILHEAQSLSAVSSPIVADEAPSAPVDLAGFLSAYGNDAAAVLLALAAGAEPNVGDVVRVASDLLGIGLEVDLVETLLKQIPDRELDPIRDVLRNNGWGAHLRRVESRVERGGQDG